MSPLGYDPASRTAYRRTAAPAGSLLDRAGINEPPRSGRHVVELLMGAAGHEVVAEDARELLGQLFMRVADAVEILRTCEQDGEARRAALRVLTGDPS